MIEQRRAWNVIFEDMGRRNEKHKVYGVDTKNLENLLTLKRNLEHDIVDNVLTQIFDSSSVAAKAECRFKQLPISAMSPSIVALKRDGVVLHKTVAVFASLSLLALRICSRRFGLASDVMIAGGKRWSNRGHEWWWISVQESAR